MVFGREHLSQYNHAKSPWFQVAINGKVDIGIEIGNEQKVGLSSEGMFTLVNEWLDSSHSLTKAQKAILLEKLEK
ncbi:hypothetical protein [Sporosarcina sp. OR05]|uniref:hypothetical protein n=1 Tax=Sporosarcina sp. OR05 TaxID=2969819 RepID=UPI00352BCC85